jgi:exopolyphosphatase/guanosine-5'-triphosphate,3'-diphosphate pyrophosphatase
MFKLPTLFKKSRSKPQVVAAVDLGSNSFHLLVVRINDRQLQVLDRQKEMVRLGTGLDANNVLSMESQQRAFQCLARFGQQLRHMPIDNVRVVGTNILRQAVNAAEFIEVAEEILGHSVEIIAGREEARLIYLGVAHTLALTSEKRLVIDIGGGSTEFIIGKGYDTLQRESLTMGCVNWMQQYFPKGIITEKTLRRAEIAALLELQPIETSFRQMGWDVVVGASGTLRTVEEVIITMGWGNEINATTLQQLRRALIEVGDIEHLLKKLRGVSSQRAPVFIGGVAILMGIVEGLKVERMRISEAALREGIIYDFLGRLFEEDARERTIEALTKRYYVDVAQAKRVENTALWCLSQLAQIWDLTSDEYAQILSWAARLHEIGLSISHDQYHKHGAYLLTYSDLAGFSRQEQTLLATLVRSHRRKLLPELCQNCTQMEQKKLIQLSILLRLAVLLHRSRHTPALPPLMLQVIEGGLKIQFPTRWLEQHPLTQADLEQESDYLRAIKFQLHFE